jgi:photosystem II stability/assembly factor-like uncharacterized protein
VAALAVAVAVLAEPAAQGATAAAGTFLPTSFSFPTASVGWLLGDRPCQTPQGDLCIQLRRTTNGGRTWTIAHLPSGLITEAAGEGLPYDQESMEEGLTVTFADRQNGWIYGALVYGTVDGVAQRSSVPVLWSTHDGGHTWRKIELERAVRTQSAYLNDIQTIGTSAYAIVAYGQEIPRTLQVLTTPVSADRWRPEQAAHIQFPTALATTASFFTDGSDRYLIVGGTTQATGARFTRSRWVSWPNPCASVDVDATVPAITSTGTMYAACPIVDAGAVVPPAAPPGALGGQVWLYTSTDHGTSFHAISQIPMPAGSEPGSIAASPGGILLAINGEVLASFNAGHTWTPVWNQKPVAMQFLTPTIAAALVAEPGVIGAVTGQLIMTNDSGHTWHPVTF